MYITKDNVRVGMLFDISCHGEDVEPCRVVGITAKSFNFVHARPNPGPICEAASWVTIRKLRILKNPAKNKPKEVL